MAGSFRMYKHMWIERRLSDFELRGLCGAIVHDTAIDQPLKPWQFVKPVPERRFKLGAVPQAPVVKLGRKDHVQAFFDCGALQLGSFHYYNAFDHPEIGDNQEGVVTLVGRAHYGVMGGKYGSGYDQRVLCAFVGEADRDVLKRFGYDSGFRIVDVIGFPAAVAAAINSVSHTFGKCVYRPHKAVLGFPGDTFNRNELSHRAGEIVRAAKHFIKPACYSHQKEFRFLWEQPADVAGAVLIECPSAREYCAPLSRGTRLYATG
jgi:hypothetical protein